MRRAPVRIVVGVLAPDGQRFTGGTGVGGSRQLLDRLNCKVFTALILADMTTRE
jgi:hypothetical protein